MLHLIPSPPHTTPGQPSPEMPPLSSIVNEGVLLVLVSLATLILSRKNAVLSESMAWAAQDACAFPVRALLGARSALPARAVSSGKPTYSSLIVSFSRPPRSFVTRLSGPSASSSLQLFEETFLRGYLQFTLTRGFSPSTVPSPHRSGADAFGFWAAASFSAPSSASATAITPARVRSACSPWVSSASPSSSACGERAHSGGPSAPIPPGTGPSPSSTVSATAAT